MERTERGDGTTTQRLRLLLLSFALALPGTTWAVDWGHTGVGTQIIGGNISRAQGGLSPNLTGMTITSISVHVGPGATGEMRLGVYLGGQLSDPTAATLLWDAGLATFAGEGWYTIPHPSGGVAWPAGEITWLAFVTGDDAVEMTYGSSAVGDFDPTRGRNNADWPLDQTIPFPATYGSWDKFGDWWYDIYVTYSAGPIPCPPATACWDGGGLTNDWSEAANWEADTLPGPTDAVLFDGRSAKPSSVDSPTSISGLTLSAAYGGSLTLAADLTNDGGLTLAGGSVDLATFSLLQGGDAAFGASIPVSAGIGGTMVFTGSLQVSGSVTLVALRLDASSNATLTLAPSAVLQTGTFTLAGSGAFTLEGGDLTVTGELFVLSSAPPSVLASTGRLRLIGAGLQRINGNAVLGGGALPPLLIDAASSRVQIAGQVTVAGSIEVAAGQLEHDPLAANGLQVVGGAVSLLIGPGASWVNHSGQPSNLELGGDVSLSGSVDFDAGAAGCGDADTISLASTLAGTPRSWGGLGASSMIDVSVSDQTGALPITVIGGTDVGGNSGGWTIQTFCGGAGLAFRQGPTPVRQDAVLSPAIEVEVRDATGTLVASATDTITLVLAGGSGGATLLGTASVAAVGGIATFSNLSVDTAGTGYTLGASAPTLISTSSTAFEVLSLLPDRVTLLAPATAVAGNQVVVQISAVDSSGQAVPGAVDFCVDAVALGPGSPQVDPGPGLAGASNPSITSACGTTEALTGLGSVLLVDTMAETVDLNASSVGLPGSGNDDTASVVFTVGSAHHVLFQTPAGTLAACSTGDVFLQVVDVYDNPVLDPASAQVLLTIVASAPTGSPTIVATTLQSPTGVPGPLVAGTTLSDGSAALRLTHDQPETVTLQATSPALPAAATSEVGTTVFVVGAADTTLSTLGTSTGTLVGGQGQAQITVTPIDACGLGLGAGRTVTVSTDFGQIGPVTDQGDGSYTASFTSSACGQAATVSASAEGVDLLQTAIIDVTCLPIDLASPVTVDLSQIEACASGGTWALIDVVPRATDASPYPAGRTLTVVSDLPGLVVGTVTETVDGSGFSHYAVQVGSNRCAITAATLTLSVDGVSLATTVAVTFTCPPVEPAGITFVASPAVLPADDLSLADVVVTVSDRCGNPAFGRTVALVESDLAHPLTLTPATQSTFDRLADPSDGTATFRASSTVAGATGVRATIEGVESSSAADLLTFTQGEVLQLELLANPTSAVAGQELTLELTLTHLGNVDLSNLAVRFELDRLELVSATGSAKLESGAWLVEQVPAGTAVTVRFVARVTTGTGTFATAVAQVEYGAATPVRSAPVNISILASPSSGTGCECGSVRSPGSWRALWVFALAPLLWLGRRRRRHQSRQS